MISVICKKCGKKLKASGAVEGEKARCPKCKTVFVVTSGTKLQARQNWTSPSTGMEFVWIDQMQIWVGKYEVTNAEYRRKEAEHDSRGFSGQTFNRDNQPVVYVNFDDAKAYAKWMTEMDREKLLQNYRYRLPSEDEWVSFVQCGDNREYPWGNEWPPASGQAGNYADETLKREIRDWPIPVLSDYNDGHALSAPVNELWVNPWGLAGVGGNVAEACASDTTGRLFGAWRGASWMDYDQFFLRCSYHFQFEESYRKGDLGFRLALSH